MPSEADGTRRAQAGRLDSALRVDRDRPSPRQRSRRKMRPEGFIESHSVSAMQKDEHAARPPIGLEEIESLSSVLAVRSVEFRAIAP